MRGLNEAYNLAVLDKDIKKEIARLKLIKGIDEEVERYYDLGTQRGLELRYIYCGKTSFYIPNHSGKYSLVCPYYEYSNFNFRQRNSDFIIWSDYELDYDAIKQKIDFIKSQLSSSNLVKKIGNLSIHFCRFELGKFIIGIMNNSIVFLFKLDLWNLNPNKDIKVELKDLFYDTFLVFTLIGMTSVIFYLSVDNYEIKEVSYDKFRPELYDI